ncbi:MAG TPA: stage V sporulation protein AE [Clostridiales bacterium]|nr:stage V sporulation protein AE [Clostridiales bacterium]
MSLTSFVLAFVVGGLICVLAQLTLDLGTNLTPAHVMVLFVVLGAVASGLGLYEPLIEFAGAGASVPLPAFGHALVKGMLKGAAEKGLSGLLAGGLTGTALGLTVAILAGLAMALVARPKG